MTAVRKVIGCVWGAHRQLVRRMGDGAPAYEWCEQQWRERLTRRAPGGNALPGWLEMELWAARRRHQAERRAEPVQLDLWGAA